MSCLASSYTICIYTTQGREEGGGVRAAAQEVTRRTEDITHYDGRHRLPAARTTLLPTPHSLLSFTLPKAHKRRSTRGRIKIML